MIIDPWPKPKHAGYEDDRTDNNRRLKHDQYTPQQNLVSLAQRESEMSHARRVDYRLLSDLEKFLSNQSLSGVVKGSFFIASSRFLAALI